MRRLSVRKYEVPQQNAAIFFDHPAGGDIGLFAGDQNLMQSEAARVSERKPENFRSIAFASFRRAHPIADVTAKITQGLSQPMPHIDNTDQPAV